MSDVCMLYQGNAPHPAHEAFGDEVGADYRHFETGATLDEETANVGSPLARVRTAVTLPSRYDVVVAEGSAPLQTALVDALVSPGRRTVYLAADETFLTLPERPSRFLWRGGKPLTERLLDGCVAVGQDVADWFAPYGDVPTEIVHPPISDEKYDLLAALEPRSPDELVVLHAGNSQPSKNQRALVEAVRSLAAAADRDISLVLLGEDHETQPYASLDFVRTPGFVPLEEFAACFERATVYVQPSTGDSFPVSTLEAMLSGTPTIVSDRCGTRQLVDTECVVGTTAAEIQRGIRTMIRKPATERERIGRTQREQVVDLTVRNQCERFRDAMEVLT